MTVDGGSVTTTAGSVTVVQNDAGNPLPVDTEPGTALSTLVVQPVPAVQQVADRRRHPVHSGRRVHHRGKLTGVAQIYCGQYVTDAGGTATAVTAPSLQLRCPAGTICGIKPPGAPLLRRGHVVQLAPTPGFL